MSDGAGELPRPDGPSRGILAKAERSLDPARVAPGVAVAMALGGALWGLWVALAPRGDPTPAFIDAVRAPSDWVPFAAFGWIMALGASRRCFDFGWPTLAGGLAGAAAPIAAAWAGQGPWAGPAAIGVILVGGFGWTARIGRWRYWVAVWMGACAVALHRAASLGFSLDPMPAEGLHSALPLTAAWSAAAAGLGGGVLVALTARRGDR